MAKTDIILLGLLFFYGFRGWQKGFLLSIWGPISLGLGVLISIGYYRKTQNLFISFLVSILAPFIFNFLGSALLRMGSKEKKVAVSNRFFGAVFGMLWGGGMAALVIMLVAITPVDFFLLGKVKEDVMRSTSFAVVSQVTGPFLPQWARVKTDKAAAGTAQLTPSILTAMSDPRLQAVLSDPILMQLLQDGDYERLREDERYRKVVDDPQLMAQLRQIQNATNIETLQEYQDLIQDPRVQDMMADPEVLKSIQEKNFMGLLNNEKFRKILEDPALVKKFLQLQGKMMEAGGPAGSPPNRSVSDENLP